MSQELIPITQLVLPISPEIDDQAWQQSRIYPTIESQWNVYLNQIAQTILMPYLQEDVRPVTIWPNQQSSTNNIWQFVRGTVLELDRKRLVLMPDKVLDHSELVISQEWIDIPDWAGDYFLAVQVDSDEQSLHCWGYATHQRVKTKGQYSAVDRAYHLDSHFLIPDLGALWVVQQLNPTEVTQAVISPLPAVPENQAENLLQRLAAAPTPRLEIPFELWGALICDNRFRSRLTELRQGSTSIETTRTAATEQVRTAATELSSWMQNVFATGWQTVEYFFGDEAEFAFVLRQTAEVSGIRRVKALRLANQLFLLLVSIELDADGRWGIQVQLRARDRSLTLPEGLSLALVASRGEIVQSVQARQQDNAIMLPRFRSATGTQFGIQAQLAGMTVREDFVV